VRTAIQSSALLMVSGCSGEPDPGRPADGGPRTDDDAPESDGTQGATEDGGACEPTCAPATDTLEFSFSTYPQLKNVGGSASQSAPGYSDPSCHLSIVVVARLSDGTYVALSAGCPHQCCIVLFNAAHMEFVCPCHGSIFDTGGRVIGGPAPNGLQKLSVCADDCGVYVSFP